MAAEMKARKRYAAAFKLKVIKEARAAKYHSVVAKRYGVPEQTLSNWLKAEERIVLETELPRQYSAKDIEFLEKLIQLEPELRFEMERTLAALLRLQARKKK